MPEAPGPGESSTIPPIVARSPLLDLAGLSVPLFADPARRYHYVARFEAAEPVPGGLRFDARAEDGRPLTVELSFVAAEVLRLRLGLGAALHRAAGRSWDPAGWPAEPTPMLVGRPPTLAAEALRTVEEADAVALETPALRVRVGRDPWQLSVLDRAGRRRFVEQRDDHTFFTFVTYPLGFAEDPDGRVHCYESFAVGPDDHFYGLGEQYGPLDRRGQRVVAWTRDTHGTNTTSLTYLNVPFFFSTAGWGLFLNHTEPSTYELASPSSISGTVAVEAPYLDCFLIYGPDPKEILRRYADLTGRPSLPPLWSFGVWMSRCMYRDRAQVEAVVERARAEGFPLDVVHLDPLWLKHRPGRQRDACDLVWNEAAFPDPPGFVRWLGERGVKLSLWENPYVYLDSECFQEGARRGYFVRRADGGWATALENPEAALVDFTNPEAARWWQDRHRPLLRLGVAAFKTDYGEGVPPEARFFNGQTGRELHNAYPLLYNRTVHEVTRQERGEAVVFGRSGYAGSQRYPLVWSGDAQSSWGGMAGALRGGLSLALSGFAFWSHDIGGFWNPEGPAKLPSAELYVRWAQFGLLGSHARFHGVMPNEPWEYGPEALQIVRAFARLRYRLLPYLWQQAHAACQTGLPLLRPLVLHYPDDPSARQEETEYLLGPYLLVAPLLEPARERSVYLPPGRWHDFWDGAVREGGRRIICAAPLDRVPLFVADDSVLPLAPPLDWADQRPWDPLELELRVATVAGAIVPLERGDALEVAARRGEGRVQVELEAPGRRLRLRLVGDERAVDVRASGDARELAWRTEDRAVVADLVVEGRAAVEIELGAPAG